MFHSGSVSGRSDGMEEWVADTGAPHHTTESVDDVLNVRALPGGNKNVILGNGTVDVSPSPIVATDPFAPIPTGLIAVPGLDLRLSSNNRKGTESSPPAFFPRFLSIQEFQVRRTFQIWHLKVLPRSSTINNRKTPMGSGH